MNNNHDPFRKYRDQLINDFKVFHANISMIENGEIPIQDVRELQVDINKTLQKEIDDLETKERIDHLNRINKHKLELMPSFQPQR